MSNAKQHTHAAQDKYTQLKEDCACQKTIQSYFARSMNEQRPIPNHHVIVFLCAPLCSLRRFCIGHRPCGGWRSRPRFHLPHGHQKVLHLGEKSLTWNRQAELPNREILPETTAASTG